MGSKKPQQPTNEPTKKNPKPTRCEKTTCMDFRRKDLNHQYCTSGLTSDLLLSSSLAKGLNRHNSCYTTLELNSQIFSEQKVAELPKKSILC